MLIRGTIATLTVCASLSIACGTASSGNGIATDGGDAASIGCTMDTDCKGTRVCDRGVCVEPGGVTGSGGAAGVGGSTAIAGHSGLGGSAGMDAGSGGSAGGAAAGGAGGGAGSGGSSGTGGSATCTATGSTCLKNGECCGFATGGSCVDWGTGYKCSDGCTDSSECVSACCAPLDSSKVACGPAAACYLPSPGVGDPCNSANPCANGGRCSSPTGGYCTTGCLYSIPDCNGTHPIVLSGTTYMGNRYGMLNWCVSMGGQNICAVDCYTNTDCAEYPGTTCKPITTTDPISASVCAK
jgi:hypothetical protein